MFGDKFAQTVMHLIVPEVPPEQMTIRARYYLLTVAMYCLMMALGLFALPEWFATPSFKRVLALLPFQLYLWGIIHAWIGCIAFYAAYRGSAAQAYKALVAAFVIVGLWAVGFIYNAYYGIKHDEIASWSGAVVYTTVAMLHLIQARQPIRSPFDPFLRSLTPK